MSIRRLFAVRCVPRRLQPRPGIPSRISPTHKREAQDALSQLPVASDGSSYRLSKTKRVSAGRC